MHPHHRPFKNAIVMPTKRQTKTKKTNNHVDLNEILENISASINCIADKENIIREATGNLARRVEAIEEAVEAWKVVVLVFSIIAIAGFAYNLLK